MMFHNTLIKVFFTSSLMIAPSLLIVFGADRAQAGFPSNYHLSCNNTSISGNVLSANCRKRNGQFIQSSITLKSIENIDGSLRVNNSNSIRISSYHLSCEGIFTIKNVLHARCRKINGLLKRTSVTITGIENIDGNLTYTGDPRPGRF